MSGQEFVRLWSAWRRQMPPVSRLRSGARSAPTYDIECALDHVVSSVNALGSDYLSGTRQDCAVQAARKLGELDTVAALMGDITMDAAHRTELTAYIAAMRSVLDALRSLSD